MGNLAFKDDYEPDEKRLRELNSVAVDMALSELRRLFKSVAQPITGKAGGLRCIPIGKQLGLVENGNVVLLSSQMTVPQPDILDYVSLDELLDVVKQKNEEWRDKSISHRDTLNRKIRRAEKAIAALRSFLQDAE